MPSWSAPQEVLAPYSASATSRIIACEASDTPGKILIFYVEPKGTLARYIWDIDVHHHEPKHGDGAKESGPNAENPSITGFPARVDSDIRLVQFVYSGQESGAEKYVVGDADDTVTSVAAAIPGSSPGVLGLGSAGVVGEDGKFSVAFGDYDTGGLVIGEYTGKDSLL
ncbi:hypothetical protein V8F06_014358 [Rhypophila decipiens]